MFSFKLAASGMKGRKRDTRLLITVLSLAFVFIIVSVTFISSVNYSNYQEKFRKYGEWQSVFLGASRDTYNGIVNIFDANEAKVTHGISRLIGKSTKLGFIGTYDETFLRLSHFDLIEGQYPEEVGELIIEKDYLNSLGLSVGDTVDSTILLDLGVIDPISQELARIDATRKFYHQAAEYALRVDKIGWDHMVSHGMCLDLTAAMESLEAYVALDEEQQNGLWEDFPFQLWQAMDYSGLASPSGRFDLAEGAFLELTYPSDEVMFEAFSAYYGDALLETEGLSEEKLLELESVYLDFYRLYYDNTNVISEMNIKEYPINTASYIDVEGMRVAATRQKYMYLLPISEKYDDIDVLLEDEDKAGIASVSLNARMTFNIVGVIDTYSDEWDTSYFPVANTFVSESTYEAIYESVIKLQQERNDVPSYDAKYNIFLASDDLTPMEMYLNMAEYAVLQDVEVTTEDDWQLALENNNGRLFVLKEYYDERFYSPSYEMIYPMAVKAEWIEQEINDPDSEYAITYYDHIDAYVVTQSHLEAEHSTLMSFASQGLYGGLSYNGYWFMRMPVTSSSSKCLIQEAILYGDTSASEYEVYEMPANYSVEMLYEYYKLGTPEQLQQIDQNSGMVDTYIVNTEQTERYFAGKYKLPGDEISVEADYDPYGENVLRARINTLAYPKLEGSASNALSNAVIVIIFFITVCATLQILLTQIRRRSRRIALLKAVGATSSQISSMLMFEGLYILVFSLPIGLIVGFPLIYGLLALINATGTISEILFHIDITRLIVGIALGIIALFIGMLIPMIIAIRTPLRGRFQMAVPRERAHKKAASKPVTFSMMRKRSRKLNRGRIVLEMLLSTLIASILLISITIGFNSYFEYNDEYVFKNRPDFAVTVQYGMNESLMDRMKAQFEAIEGVEAVYATKFAQDIYVDALPVRLTKNGAESPIIESLMDAALAGGVYDELFYGEYDELLDQVDDALAGSITVTSTITGEQIEIGINAILSGNDFSYEYVAAGIPITIMDPATGAPYDYVSEEPMMLFMDQRTLHMYFADAENTEKLLSAIEYYENKRIGQYKSVLYTYNEEDALWDEIFEMVDVGEINRELFKRSEDQVILIMPLISASMSKLPVTSDLLEEDLEPADRIKELIDKNGLISTLDSYYEDCLESEQFIKVGDMLALGATTTVLRGETSEEIDRDMFVEVVGIIYTMEDEIWPYSDTIVPYSFIGSSKLLAQILPNTDPPTSQFADAESYAGYLTMRKIIYGTSWGETEFYIYCDDGANFENIENTLRYGCKSTGFAFLNYHSEGQALYEQAMSNAITYVMLGLSAIMIAIVILNSTIGSAMDQDRRRYGVLQSIGVQTRRFVSEQLHSAIKHSLVALIIGHLIVAAIVLVSNITKYSAMENMWQFIWAVISRSYTVYPLAIHVAACAAFILIEIAIYLVPLRRICNFSPIENIRS